MHTCSLVVDDVVDNSPLRRGLPAAHVQFGVPLVRGLPKISEGFISMYNPHSVSSTLLLSRRSTLPGVAWVPSGQKANPGVGSRAKIL